MVSKEMSGGLVPKSCPTLAPNVCTSIMLAQESKYENKLSSDE